MSHDLIAITALLHEGGYRVTPQRQLIIDAVCQLGGHVTPDQVYEQVHEITPTLNRATVYRTLAFLSDQGILNPVLQEDGHAGYELASSEPHHHLICRGCGEEQQIAHDLVEHLFEQIGSEYNFVVETKHLTLFGRCEDCRDAQASQL